jgi:hypothetical protein
MKRDLKGFDTRNIPMTEGKKDMIKACLSPVDEIIINNYNKFKQGILCDEAL